MNKDEGFVFNTIKHENAYSLTSITSIQLAQSGVPIALQLPA
jgi:hypothetical protein